MMRLEQNSRKPETTSCLYFTKDEVKTALIMFAEVEGKHFECLSSELNLIFPLNYPGNSNETDTTHTILRITKQGTKAGIE